jgi:uncharacterized membrane protein
MIKVVLLNVHLIATIVWIGAVFMGTFIDWPSAKQSVKENEFPFRFIVGQGSRVFYSVYTGIFLIWTSGIGLVITHPPQTPREIMMLAGKTMALLFMTGFTMYGTFSTWPKLQVATHKEAHRLYENYMRRAMATFTFGLIAAVLGLWVY